MRTRVLGRSTRLLVDVIFDRLALVTVGEMVIPVPALPFVVPDNRGNGVPEWDVTSSCRAGAVATEGASPETRLKSLIDSEHRTREKLLANGPHFRRQTKFDALMR